MRPLFVRFSIIMLTICALSVATFSFAVVNSPGSTTNMGGGDNTDDDTQVAATVVSQATTAITNIASTQGLNINLQMNSTAHKNIREYFASQYPQSPQGPAGAVTIFPGAASEGTTAPVVTPVDRTVDNMQNIQLGLPKAGIWGRYVGNYGDQGEIDGIDGYDYWSHGVLFGFDRFVSKNAMLGILAGYVNSDVDFDSGTDGNATFTRAMDAESNIDTFAIGAYGNWVKNRFLMSGTLLYSYSNIDGDASISEDNGSVQTGTSEYDTDSQSVSLSLTTGYQFSVGKTGILTPLFGINTSFVNVDGYTDTVSSGITATASEVEDFDATYFNTSLALRGDLVINPRSILRSRLEWKHEFGDLDDAPSSRVAGTNTAWTTNTGLDMGRDRGLWNIGMHILPSEVITIDIDYDLELGEEFSSHTGSFMIKYCF
jgi:uncharacterized protein with beta-barrel porin domain